MSFCSAALEADGAVGRAARWAGSGGFGAGAGKGLAALTRGFGSASGAGCGETFLRRLNGSVRLLSLIGPPACWTAAGGLGGGGGGVTLLTSARAGTRSVFG